MTDQHLYEIIHGELFKTGSSKYNQWFTIRVQHDDKLIHCEALINQKGFIHVRKPVGKRGLNDEGEMVYRFDVYRFTGKRELKYSHMIYDVRLKEAI